MGSDVIQRNFEEGAPDMVEKTERQVLALLRERIRPEFLNRIDETIVFRPLTKEQIAQVVRIQLDRVVKTLADNNLQLTYTDRAVEYIATLGFDPQYGARPVKRVIQREVLNPLSVAVLEGQVSSDQPIELDFENEKVKFLSR